MDLVEALRTTGSARDFTDQPVDDATVAAILDDARFAPSGGNRQPWRVAVVKDSAIRRSLADLMTLVWHEYLGESADTSRAAFAFGRSTGATPIVEPNPLLDDVEHVPVMLAIAADLNKIALMDANTSRPPLTAGGSIYPFCWSILLAARARGLGGVMTTFLSRAEDAAAPQLGLPKDHALAATVFLGYPTHLNTKLRRGAVSELATIDRFDGPPLADLSSGPTKV
ncbi:MAG TPA: nitroreductase family protein [Ilumatobacteraceae bacterium]|nr:nitroreductase family protein [Ilumatobacteraceae bacterium]